MSQERFGPAQRQPVQRAPTRRQTSRRQQEERRQRIAVFAVIGLAALALLIILVPFLKTSLWDPRQTLAVVGDQAIRRSDYIKQQRLNGVGLGDPMSLSQALPAYRADRNGLRDQLEQSVQTQEDSEGQVDPSALDAMVENAVLVQSAGAAGVNITDADVDARLNQASVQPTPEPIPTAAESPTTAPGATTTAGPVAQASAPAASPTPVPPSAEEVNGFFGVLNDTIGVSRKDYERMVIRPTLVRERFLEKNQPKSAEQVHVRHILVPTEAAAKEMIKDLKAGEKFEVLARERSTDEGNKNKGGDLGWAPRGNYVPEFEKAAFSLQKPGQLSEPVKTQFGYHIIQLLERAANRPLTEAQADQTAQKKLQDFIKEQRRKLEQENRLQIEIPATPTVAPAPTPTAIGAG